MCYVPIPGIGYPDLSLPEKNWAHYIDSLFLPGVLWQDTWDPEGILSTLPSIVTGIFGMFAGYIIKKLFSQYMENTSMLKNSYILVSHHQNV